MSKKVLITGGTGFAGSHLVELLQVNPNLELHVTHVAPVPDQVASLFNQQVQYHEVDLTNQEAVQNLFSTIVPDEIYQLASIAAVGESHTQTRKVLPLNQSLIINMVESMRICSPAAKMLVISSAEVYGRSQTHELPIKEDHPLRPANPYGVSKVTQDLLAAVYARSFDLNIVIARPFNHIGERQERGFVVSDFARQVVLAKRGEQAEINVGNLDAQRDFTDVKDTVKAYRLLMEHGKLGEVYNIGTGRVLSIREVIEIMQSIAGTHIPLHVDESRLRPSDIPVMNADATKISALGWAPESTIELALERVLNYWRNIQ